MRCSPSCAAPRCCMACAAARPADFDAIADPDRRSFREFAAAIPQIKEMDLNPIVAYADGITTLDARICSIGPQRAQARVGDRRSAPRGAIENLKRAFEPRSVAVIGDKRMGGYMWLRAMKRFTGKLYSVQIDPNEIPGIEAMGVTNNKSLAEIPEHDRLCGQRGAAPGRAAHPKGLRRQQGRLDRIFHFGIFRDDRGAGHPARRRAAANRDRVRYRAGRSQLHGAVQPGDWAVQFSRLRRGRAGRRMLHLAERHAHDQLLAAGGAARDQGEQGGVDRQRADARGRGLYRSDGRRSDDAGARDVRRRRARRPPLLREPAARGGKTSRW